MDNKMIEKISKAAYEKFNENLIGCCEEPWDALPIDFKTRMMCAQVAAVKAMREPTEKMILAGGEVLLKACSSDKGNLRPWKPFDVAQASIKIWTAEIDAIIGEE